MPAWMYFVEAFTGEGWTRDINEGLGWIGGDLEANVIPEGERIAYQRLLVTRVVRVPSNDQEAAGVVVWTSEGFDEEEVP